MYLFRMKDFSRFPPPELKDLQNFVGAEWKYRWQDIATGLGVTGLNNIMASHQRAVDQPGDCMRDVFSRWESEMTSDYTYEKLAEVLKSLGMIETRKKLHEELSNLYPPQ